MCRPAWGIVTWDTLWERLVRGGGEKKEGKDGRKGRKAEWKGSLGKG
jgi:hypothetical protein